MDHVPSCVGHLLQLSSSASATPPLPFFNMKVPYDVTSKHCLLRLSPPSVPSLVCRLFVVITSPCHPSPRSRTLIVNILIIVLIKVLVINFRTHQVGAMLMPPTSQSRPCLSVLVSLSEPCMTVPSYVMWMRVCLLTCHDDAIGQKVRQSSFSAPLAHRWHRHPFLMPPRNCVCVCAFSLITIMTWSKRRLI